MRAMLIRVGAVLVALGAGGGASAAAPRDLVDSGTQCFGMHCCPSGHGMRGYHHGNNQLLCRQLAEPEEDCFLDGPTARQGIHACPQGTYMKGLHAEKNLLTCCFSRRRGYSVLGSERVDSGSQAFGMHGCPAPSGQDGFMTGIHVANDQFLCATAPQTPPTIENPVEIGLDPFGPKTFSRFYPAVAHGTWKKAVRNWLRRVLDVPVDGSHRTVPTIREIERVPVEGEVTRVEIGYPSLVDRAEIKAYLFLPKGYDKDRSYPAALVSYGHSPEGKDGTGEIWDMLPSDDNVSYHAHALYLAQQGMITLAPDTRSWNEYIVEGVDHYPYTEKLRAITGHDGGLASMMALDQLRNVTVLTSTPGVDNERVHAVGLSLGGWQSLYVSALDPRITGGVIASGIFWTLECLNEPNLGHRCQTVRGLSASLDSTSADLLLDSGEIAALIAPRSLFAQWGAQDGLFATRPSGGSETCAQRGRAAAQATYDLLEIGGRFQYAVIAGMLHELDNTTAYRFLTGMIPVDRLDYGTVCHGMHCCPSGNTMGGLHAVRNDFICRDAVPRERELCNTINVARQDMLACPAGTYARGYHEANNQLTCCWDGTRGPVPFRSEILDPLPGHPVTQAQGMHVCPRSTPMVTGIHVVRNQLLCAAR